MAGYWGDGFWGDGWWGSGADLLNLPGRGASHVGLSVVLVSSLGSLNLTRVVSNLVVKNVSPGGYASVEFDLPRRLDQTRLPHDSQIRVYDTATAEQVGGGRLIEQGLSSDGMWRVSCLGEGLAALQDRTEPYMVIDTNPETTPDPVQIGVTVKQVGGSKRKAKKRKKGSKAAEKGIQRPFKITTGVSMAEVKRGTAPNGTDVEGLLFQVPAGIEVNPSAAIVAQFRGPYRCGQKLGAYIFRYVSGTSSTDFTLRADAQTVPGGGADTETLPWVTSSPAGAWKVHGTNFDSSRNAFQLRVVTGAAGTTGPNAWTHVRELRIRSQMLDESGTPRPGSWHAAVAVTAGPVFTDLIVRRCPSLKVGTVATGSHPFTHLTWYDGVSAKDVLDELTDEDDTLTYHAWEADADGKTAIHLTVKPTTVRYELTPEYGYSGPSPTSDVFTRVIVTGVDGDGYQVRQEFDRTPAGQVPRSETIRLAEDWTGPRATEIANAFLDNHAAPPNSGTITVAKPVLDLVTGRWVKPWAIRSGELCRVRGVQPSVDALNPEAKQDGVTIFRIATSTFNADSGTASLELDTPVFDQERAIADLIS